MGALYTPPPPPPVGGEEHPSSVKDRPVDADFREVQPLLLLCCRQLGLHPQFERLQGGGGKSLTQIAVHGSLVGRVLPPIHFPCQFSRGLRSHQHRLRYHCFGHSTHRRLSSPALDVLHPLSLEIEDHSAFESSGLYLQLLGYLHLGHAEVDEAGNAMTCYQSILLDHG